MNSDNGRTSRASDWSRTLLPRFVFEDTAAALGVTCMGKSGDRHLWSRCRAVGNIQDNVNVIPRTTRGYGVMEGQFHEKIHVETDTEARSPVHCALTSVRFFSRISPPRIWAFRVISLQLTKAPSWARRLPQNCLVTVPDRLNNLASGALASFSSPPVPGNMS